MLRAVKRRLPLAAAVLALLAIAGCGGSGNGKGSAQRTTARAAPSCQTVKAPPPKGEQHLRKPASQLASGKAWTATVATNCGSFTIALDVKRAPKTASSFAYLARKGFYDGLTFHRIVPGFVIQGGDPLGTGAGGPGYTIVEAPPRDLSYTHGVVAMAKTPAEPDGASGSQFFVVLAPDAGLPPQYALVGKVTQGLDVVDAIAKVPLRADSPEGSSPQHPVVIDSIAIRGS
jgi:peptidyl-prolyl cis-trans isomerase B (cyclophilin B)